MDGWFGPKLTVRTSSSRAAGCSIVGTGDGIARALVDAASRLEVARRPLCRSDGHVYSSPEKRTGSPPIG